MRRLPSCFALLLLSLAARAHAGDAGSCRYVPIGELPITLAAGSQEPLIEGAINGDHASMLVDTGADTSLMMRSAAEKRGIPFDSTGQYLYGVGGASQSFVVRLRDFSAGPTHSGKMAMQLVGDTSMTKVAYDAIIGAEFLLQADMEFSLSGKVLKFYRPNDCRDTFLAYWDRDAMEIPFTKSEEHHRNPHFDVTINGKTFTAMIDSGSAASFIVQNAAERAGVSTSAPGVTPASRISGIGNATLDRWNATFASFTLGSETIQNAAIGIMAMPQTGRLPVDVILGRDFLRSHRVLFAMSQQRLYVSYAGGPVFAPAQATAAVPAPAGH